MSRVLGSARLALRALVMLSVAATALAACGPPSTSTLHVVGVPSTGISVPLATIGCTGLNSCIAVGTSNASVGPSAVGEYRLPSGRWAPIAVPSLASSSIVASACWTSGCLFAGTQPSGDLVWRYDSTNHSVVAVNAPTGGLGVSAITCFAPMSCAVVDGVVPRLSFTTDGGGAWVSGTAITSTAHATVTSLSCTSALDCLVAMTDTGATTLLVTADGGATWTPLTIPSSWSAVESLACVHRHCVAIAETSQGSRLVRSSSYGAKWAGVALSGHANALACAQNSHCVVVGQSSGGATTLTVVVRSTTTSARLQYVPSPLLEVACGTKVCAAIGVTTVLALRP